MELQRGTAPARLRHKIHLFLCFFCFFNFILEFPQSLRARQFLGENRSDWGAQQLPGNCGAGGENEKGEKEREGGTAGNNRSALSCPAYRNLKVTPRLPPSPATPGAPPDPERGAKAPLPGVLLHFIAFYCTLLQFIALYYILLRIISLYFFIFFHSILLYFILFIFILFFSFYLFFFFSPTLFHSILFHLLLFQFIPFYSTLFHFISFYLSLFLYFFYFFHFISIFSIFFHFFLINAQLPNPPGPLRPRSARLGPSAFLRAPSAPREDSPSPRPPLALSRHKKPPHLAPNPPKIRISARSRRGRTRGGSGWR